MRDHLVGAPLGRQPEAALAIAGQPLDIHQLRRIAPPRHRQRRGDPRRFLRRVEGIDRRRRRERTVRSGEQLPRLRRIGGQRRKRRPADQGLGARAGQRRIGGRAVRERVEHHMRRGEPVFAQIDLIRGGQKPAGRDRHQTFGADPRGQDLQEFRRRQIGQIIDRHQRGPFGGNEKQLATIELRHLDRFDLDAFLVALVGVMAQRRHLALKAGARFKNDAAVLVPDRETAGTALPVALVRGDEMIGVDPFHPVGLARDPLFLAGEIELAVLFRVDPRQIDRARGKMRGDLAIGADHHDFVVFLQRHDDLARRVDRDEFRLGIVARHRGQPGQLDLLLRAAVHRPLGQWQFHQIARGGLRQIALVHLLVALVFDRNGQEAAIGGLGDGIGLPAQIAVRHDLLPAQIHRHQLARGLGLAFRGVHPGKGAIAQHHRRRRLAAHRHRAKRFRRRRIGNVDQPQNAQRAVGIDQLLPVFGRGDDLGRGGVGRLGAGRVQRRRKSGNAVEALLGMGGKGRGKRQRRGQAKAAKGHGIVLSGLRRRTIPAAHDGAVTKRRRPDA